METKKLVKEWFDLWEKTLYKYGQSKQRQIFRLSLQTIISAKSVMTGNWHIHKMMCKQFLDVMGLQNITLLLY